MSEQAATILGIVVLVPLFAAAAVGGFFLPSLGGRRGMVLSWASFSTAVAIPIFAFSLRAGFDVVHAVLRGVIGGPLIVTAVAIYLAVRMGLENGTAAGASRMRNALRNRRHPPLDLP